MCEGGVFSATRGVFFVHVFRIMRKSLQSGGFFQGSHPGALHRYQKYRESVSNCIHRRPNHRQNIAMKYPYIIIFLLNQGIQ